jgi:hypothetical protein
MVKLRTIAYVGLTLGVLLIAGCGGSSSSSDDGTDGSSVKGLKAPEKVSAVEAK